MAAAASFDAQFLNIPIRALVINGETFPIVVREATFERFASRHDLVKMSVVVEGDLQFDGRIRISVDDETTAGSKDVDMQTLVDQPCSFVYGIAPDTEQFIGYVLSVEPDQQFKEGVNYVISFIGATYKAQAVRRRFDTNVTATDMCRNRVHYWWLGFDGDDTVYKWSSAAQTGQTDWDYCVSLANNSGLLLFTWGAVVRFKDPRELLKQYPYTRLVSSDDLLETDRKLIDFSPRESSAQEIDKQPVELFFFDNDGKVVSAKQPTTLTNVSYRPFADFSIENREMADHLIAASAKSVARWLHGGTCRIRGDASIYPGVMVEIDTGTKSTTVRFNGRWLVMGVKHSMTREVFSTELSLGRPGDFIPQVSQSSYEHFWQKGDRGRPGVTLRDGQWFSSWTDPSVRIVA